MQKIVQVQEKAQQEILGPNGFDIGPFKYICNEREVTSIGLRKGPKTIREILNQVFPQYSTQEFVVFNDRRYTFQQVKSEILKICSIFKSFGVKRNDRIAVAGKNSDYWIFIYLATNYYGATSVPINALWKTDELAYALDDSGTSVLFCDPERFNRVKPLIDSEVQALHAKVVVIDPEFEKPNIKFDGRIHDFDQLRSKATPMNENDLPRDADTEDTACLMYTSGSTGYPKGVCQTHNNISQYLKMNFVAAYVGKAVNSAMKQMNKDTSKDPQPCIILAVPLFHATALHAVFTCSFFIGRKVVLMSRWNAAKALELIAAEKPTMWIGVPTMVQDIMEHPNYSKTDVSSLKVVLSGGAPTPQSQVSKIKDKFKSGGAIPSNGYGMTETVAGFCGIGGDEYLQRPTSCGKVAPIAEGLVIDLDLAEQNKFLDVGVEKMGELVVRSPLVLTKYYNKKEKTDEVIIEVEGKGYGFLRTGDIAKIDKEGYVYILDRAKDIIIRGGENISCAEVESALFHHPDVMECAVYGIRDERLGELVGSTVTLKENSPSYNKLKKGCSSAEELQIKKDIVAHAENNIAKFKVPEIKHMELTLEILPRGGTGKILKRELRDKANQKISAKL